MIRDILWSATLSLAAPARPPPWVDTIKGHDCLPCTAAQPCQTLKRARGLLQGAPGHVIVDGRRVICWPGAWDCLATSRQ